MREILSTLTSNQRTFFAKIGTTKLYCYKYRKRISCWNVWHFIAQKRLHLKASWLWAGTQVFDIVGKLKIHDIYPRISFVILSDPSPIILCTLVSDWLPCCVWSIFKLMLFLRRDLIWRWIEILRLIFSRTFKNLWYDLKAITRVKALKPMWYV